MRIPHHELTFTFARSSGPGGQNVNKLNTKAILRWPVATSLSITDAVRARFLARYRSRITHEGDLIVSSQRFRDQRRNIADCMDKLRQMLDTVEIAPVPRKRTRPSRGARQRRLKSKRRHSQKKQVRRSALPEE